MKLLADRIRDSISNRIADDHTIDPHKELTEVLAAADLDPNAGGGSVIFEGRDPILPSPLPIATMAAVALMAKSVAIADLWRFRTGQGQDLSIRLDQALHRLCPFYDRRWEFLNGYSPAFPHDPFNPFILQPLYQARNGRWVQFASIYPRARSAALTFLDCSENVDAVSAAIAKWDAFELEEAANAVGLQANVVRTPEEFLSTNQFPFHEGHPIVEIEKIGESEPEPFLSNPRSPLDGVRAIGLGHVIAGAGLGRALAYHGADVLNVWGPKGFEFDLMYYTANVGMRSTTLEIGEPNAMSRFMDLARGADVFFANRRPGYLRHMGLDAAQLAATRPGLIHVEITCFGPRGPWSNRIGFDNNAGGISGIYTLEGTPEQPSLTEIGVVNDYAMAWIAEMAVVATLKRRAIEGGSYRITISLIRLSLWMLQMGLFDKDYARSIAGTPGDHWYGDPEVFQVETPCGLYQGVTDQVRMSLTPGAFRTPLVPRGSSRAEWLLC